VSWRIDIEGRVYDLSQPGQPIIDDGQGNNGEDDEDRPPVGAGERSIPLPLDRPPAPASTGFHASSRGPAAWWPGRSPRSDLHPWRGARGLCTCASGHRALDWTTCCGRSGTSGNKSLGLLEALRKL
jgi:hypothetical protein